MQAVRIAFGLGGIYDEDEAKDVMRNESQPGVNAKRIEDLNAAVTAHPTAEGQVIDANDASDPPGNEDPIIDQDVPDDGTGGDPLAWAASHEAFHQAVKAWGKAAGARRCRTARSTGRRARLPSNHPSAGERFAGRGFTLTETKR
jgi:hypothetical protein